MTLCRSVAPAIATILPPINSCLSFAARSNARYSSAVTGSVL
ncbi:MAG TPA: hypothetical protein VGP58_05920 [Pyrinomonadaceae bacterium]|nr:hypothetical protein [Pyrinomonadaceae bacterium]